MKQTVVQIEIHKAKEAALLLSKIEHQVQQLHELLDTAKLKEEEDAER
jgi:hypothetical protein